MTTSTSFECAKVRIEVEKVWGNDCIRRTGWHTISSVIIIFLSIVGLLKEVG